MRLTNRTFELIDNDGGYAKPGTVMRFGPDTDPFSAAYSGGNIQAGHAIVHIGASGTKMAYHALTTDGDLLAGLADVALREVEDETILQLRWHWLTGAGEGKSEGVSRWRELRSDR